MIRTVAAVLCLMPQTIHAAEHQFCWIGNAGYTMTGVIGYPDALANTGIINQDQVTRFEIVGYLDGVEIGSWSLDRLTPTTSWTLFFDTTNLRFPMGGILSRQSYQEWNANGFANDCGRPGFGFNGGNRAQDVCVDGRFIDPSGIDPDTPLPVVGMDVDITAECTGIALMSELVLRP